MNTHQPESDHDSEAAPAEARNEASPEAAPDALEPDFSLLRQARASLDNAFPED